mmetsp:Transcript_19731/g.30911  ORF Transcript_19731/g.30911 Transcript_19731/m.30911 type:complete len:210 (+) Transcript_19731:41-670(+)|eukprot:CAMPEP_0184312400 /NCGR_PEP_ID=MMETSP1049-20130417/49911_1 /TAXON_ID=77928 /ORGANISM="Proteomonas sulcata, Strain CCMP704" /LENGTH=209 /DNA_ID=CAMNT_0026628543 /DNA_START=34 /DNA_END=663 /DNA_ORIENTATION=+
MTGTRQTLVSKLKDKLERRLHGGEYAGSTYGAFPPPPQPPSGMQAPIAPYSGGTGMMDPMTYAQMTPKGYGAPEANMLAAQSLVQDPASSGFPPVPPWSGGGFPPPSPMPMPWGQYPGFPMPPMSSPRGMPPGFPPTPGGMPLSGPPSGYMPLPPGSFGWGAPPSLTSPVSKGKKRTKTEGPLSGVPMAPPSKRAKGPETKARSGKAKK